MLVTRILGDCPGCGGKNSFGNVSVLGDRVLRGCLHCKYSTSVWLPEIRKKILYLDQFFFSGAFRGGDQRFVDAAHRIRRVSELQLLVAPYSSIHEDETHQWRGFGGKNKDDLMEFIKATSRGHEFAADYSVERTQIIRAFKAFLAGEPSDFQLVERDIVRGNIHKWDDYFRIDVGRYIKDIEQLRELKRQSAEALVDAFDEWRQSNTTFDQDVAFELQATAKSYIGSYLEFLAPIGRGDYAAIHDAPIVSEVVRSMLDCLPEDTDPGEQMRTVAQFFAFEHYRQVPCVWVKVRMFATLKDMVKRGAYRNREKALQNLNGIFQDVNHISTYAPYCDAFVMDQPMAALVRDPHVGLGDKFGVKIFSLNNWDEFFDWLDAVEKEMSDDHRTGLAAAYS